MHDISFTDDIHLRDYLNDMLDASDCEYVELLQVFGTEKHIDGAFVPYLFDDEDSIINIEDYGLLLSRFDIAYIENNQSEFLKPVKINMNYSASKVRF